MLLIKNIRKPNFDTLQTTPCDVLINEGRFLRFAPELQADAEIIDGKGMLMLPAMTDLHTHMVQSLTKGMLDDLNITDWLKKMLAVQWSLSEEEWYHGVLLGCLQALRCGVTAINDMTYFPYIDAVVQAYRDAGLRVTFGIGATDIAENEQVRVLSPEENLRQADTIYRKYHGKGLLRTSAAPQGRPANTPELMRQMKRFADERGLIYHTHLAEGKGETEKIRTLTGHGEGEELARLGVLDSRTILAHSIWLTEDEIRMIADSGARVAYCPSTNMKLSDGIPPIARMLEAGCHVAFGCDGEASSGTRDLLREARHGSLLQKVITLDPTVLPAGQCYRMLTQEAATALGYDDLGILEEGALADFSLVHTGSLLTSNQSRVLTNLLYAGSGEQVDSVYIAGKPVLQGGSFLHHDMDALLQKCEEILANIEKRIEK